MARDVQDILIVDYLGPQGSFELGNAESANVNRSKSRARVKVMNRSRRPIAFQSGTEEVSVTLTIVPLKVVEDDVDWVQAWKQDELFQLTVEKGLEGSREQIQDCMVSDINDTHNEAGEARQEVTVEGLVDLPEPS